MVQYVNSVVFLWFCLIVNLRGLWIFALYDLIFFTLCVLFGIYSFGMNFIEMLSSILSKFCKDVYLNCRICKLYNGASYSS